MSVFAGLAAEDVVRRYLDGGVRSADSALRPLAAVVAATTDHHRAVTAFLTDGPEHTTDHQGR